MSEAGVPREQEAFASLDSTAQLIADLTFDVRDEFPVLAGWKRWR